MTPIFYTVPHFYNFKPNFDFIGVSESQNNCVENEFLKLTITLLVHLQFHNEST